MADSRVGVGNKQNELGTSLVAQWLRICIAMQGTQVWSGWGIKVPHVVAVQLLSHAWLFATPWSAARQASLSFTISWSLLKLMLTESVMHPTISSSCHPLLLLSSIFPSIRVFSNESVLHIRWPKCQSFSFSISPSNIQGWFPLGSTSLISLLSKGFSRVFSNTAVWKHQFFGSQSSFWSNCHIHTWLLEKP